MRQNSRRTFFFQNSKIFLFSYLIKFIPRILEIWPWKSLEESFSENIFLKMNTRKKCFWEFLADPAAISLTENNMKFEWDAWQFLFELMREYERTKFGIMCPICWNKLLDTEQHKLLKNSRNYFEKFEEI